jgi:hypothetical protein
MPGLDGLPSFLQPANLFRAGAHALVGAARAGMSGGNSRAGALSGLIPAVAGSLPFFSSLPDFGQLVFKSVVGGLASVAGGGKFVNGAVTAAFQYLFNDWPHRYNDRGPFCVMSQPGCTYDNVVDSVAHKPFLFAPDDVTSRDTNWVPPFGNVKTVVDWENHTVTNIAQEGHSFYPGQVVHQIYEGDVAYMGKIERALFISTTGTGSFPDGFEGFARHVVNMGGFYFGYWSAVHIAQYQYWLLNYGPMAQKPNP